MKTIILIAAFLIGFFLFLASKVSDLQMIVGGVIMLFSGCFLALKIGNQINSK